MIFAHIAYIGIQTIMSLNVTHVKHVTADRNGFLKHLAETPNHTVLKLTATWCGPCKQIAEYTRQASLRLPANVDLIECDVDESFDLYASLKQKKMVNGIPVFLFYKNGNASLISDLSVTGASIPDLDAFFFRVVAAANAGGTASSNQQLWNSLK
jgi:thiol-disulfide isomerase/thioredoxin